MAYNKQIIDALNARGQQKSEEKPRKHNFQREGGLQIQCVTWFRYQYKAFSKLLIHPRNEAGKPSSRKVAIDAAAGVVPGVPDLMLLLPSQEIVTDEPNVYFGLGIELKYGKTNNQSPAQKEYQRYMEAAGYKYVVVRSLEEFQKVVTGYMSSALFAYKERVHNLFGQDDDTASNKALLKRIANR